MNTSTVSVKGLLLLHVLSVISFFIATYSIQGDADDFKASAPVHTLQMSADAFQTSTALLTQKFLNLQIIRDSSLNPLRNLGAIPENQRVFTTKVSKTTEMGVSFNTQHAGAGLHLKISI